MRQILSKLSSIKGQLLNENTQQFLSMVESCYPHGSGPKLAVWWQNL